MTTLISFDCSVSYKNLATVICSMKLPLLNAPSKRLDYLREDRRMWFRTRGSVHLEIQSKVTGVIKIPRNLLSLSDVFSLSFQTENGYFVYSFLLEIHRPQVEPNKKFNYIRNQR